MKITRTSQMTGIVHTREIECTDMQFVNWKSGMYIQDAFPNLSPEDREFIKTGITPEEWNDLFGQPWADDEGEEPLS
jgi:hypothetical protein